MLPAGARHFTARFRREALDDALQALTHTEATAASEAPTPRQLQARAEATQPEQVQNSMAP